MDNQEAANLWGTTTNKGWGNKTNTNEQVDMEELVPSGGKETVNAQKQSREPKNPKERNPSLAGDKNGEPGRSEEHAPWRDKALPPI